LTTLAGCPPFNLFRVDFHAWLTAPGDELFKLADAVLCAGGGENAGSAVAAAAYKINACCLAPATHRQVL